MLLGGSDRRRLGAEDLGRWSGRRVRERAERETELDNVGRGQTHRGTAAGHAGGVQSSTVVVR